MLINDASFREEVRRIVNGFTKNAALQEDLVQEAMVHAWRVETERPDRTRSWYLQSCRFHLQHWLALGRSVDSLKRVTVDNCVLIDADELNDYHTNGECFESVSFYDLVLTISKHLRPGEKRVLVGLVSGMRLREISRKAGLSYPTALKYRRRIAEVVSRLERLPVLAGNRKVPNSDSTTRLSVGLGRKGACPEAAPILCAPRTNWRGATARHERPKDLSDGLQPEFLLPEIADATFYCVLAAEKGKSVEFQEPNGREQVAVSCP
jgi:DNA-directed RNA polymerase specialized sigma24 family protein